MPEGVAVAALQIRRDYPPSDLRRRAGHERDRRAALRLLAIANALEGMTRAEAARLAGVERQALHDAVLRFNAEGPDGLHDRPRPGRPERLSEGQQAALKAHILRGPDPERDGVSAWRLVDPVSTSSAGMACTTACGVCPVSWTVSTSRARRRVLRTRRATRPRRRRSKKKLPATLQALAAEHPSQRLQVWCQDEARVGQKGRTTRIWYERGMRPPGVVDQRYTSLYLFAASRPGTDEAFALALPRADAGTMGVFLHYFSDQLAPDVHAVLILDQAGWHDERALRVPRNVTLPPLPTASPELNPVERIWLYLRERYLSHRILADYDALLAATYRAWNKLLAEKGRLASLTAYPYLTASGNP